MLILDFPFRCAYSLLSSKDFVPLSIKVKLDLNSVTFTLGGGG